VTFWSKSCKRFHTAYTKMPRPHGAAAMNCPRCQHENPPHAKFCPECGARLAPVCAKCHSELPAGARFCSQCGEPVATSAASRFATPEAYTPKHLAEKILTSKTALEGERKQVTVLFADLKGSMELLADRDPEEARKVMHCLHHQCQHRIEKLVVNYRPEYSHTWGGKTYYRQAQRRCPGA
jgi:ribosomal protein L40E